MLLPRIIKATYIIDVNFCLLNVIEHRLHDLLHIVARLATSHWQSFVLIVAKGSADCAYFLGIFIQFESIILHRYIQFGKELVSPLLAKDISKLRLWVNLSFDHFIEFSQV